MPPLLSIAIPSNNKTELLDEAIASLVAEPGFDHRCEICVSDNSNGTRTQELMARKYGAVARIVYRRSVDAPSLDANVNRVISIAQGKYVWVFGDDDLVVPGFLAGLLAYLEGNTPDILLVNSCSFQATGLVEASRVPETSVRVYGPREDDSFLTDFGGYLTYVPCLVIRQALWRENFRDEKIGTFFAHIDAVYRAKRGHSAHFLPQPGIRMRLHFQTWAARHFEIWNIHYPAIIWGLQGYSAHAKASVIARHPLKSPRRILAARAYGSFNFEAWRKVLWPAQDSSAAVKIIGLLVGLLPRTPFRILYILFIRVRRTKQHRGFSPALALAQLEGTAR